MAVHPYESILSALLKASGDQPIATGSVPPSAFGNPSPYAGLFKSNAHIPASPFVAATQAYLESLLKVRATKPKIFVSYHHAGDQEYYDYFSQLFSGIYDLCYDNSLERRIDSSDCDYISRRIREEYLTGTSCTVVLCGAETAWRKYVDWEIKATLDKRHALIGINLPTNPRDYIGRVHVPDRLRDNIVSGFAIWLDWNQVIHEGPQLFQASLTAARLLPSHMIENWRPLRARNGSIYAG